MNCERKQQPVLTHILCEGGRTSNFYAFDLESNKVLETPVATLPHQIGRVGIVVFKSTLYVIGGCDNSDGDGGGDSSAQGDQYIHCGGTSYFELEKPHLLSLLNHPDTPSRSIDHPVKSISGSATWKRSPTAFSHALLDHPACAALGDKIYAFRCSSEKKCIGGVFTPHSHEWKCISPPPDLPLDRFLVSSPVIPDETNHRLLVHFARTHVLYAYYPANGNWDCLDRNFGEWFSATALVDGVLYIHHDSPNFLAAYDVMTKSWLKVVYSSPFHEAYRVCEFLGMLHFGNDMLCLAMSGFFNTHVDPFPTTWVQFAKFRVKRANPAEVHVTHDAFNIFSFENTHLAFDFIAI